MNPSIKEVAVAAWQTAEDHGWHDVPRSIPELLCLMHSEISEALEEHRQGFAPNEIYFSGKDGEKPEGIPIELADVIIRIFDTCETYQIDIAKALEIKMAYNKTREYRHGNKRI